MGALSPCTATGLPDFDRNALLFPRRDLDFSATRLPIRRSETLAVPFQLKKKPSMYSQKEGRRKILSPCPRPSDSDRPCLAMKEIGMTRCWVGSSSPPFQIHHHLELLPSSIYHHLPAPLITSSLLSSSARTSVFSRLPLYTHSEQITKSFSIMQFKVILLSLASAGLAAAQGLTVNTPSSLITCVPTLIQWTGGAGPYYLFAVSAKDLIECADPSSMVPRPVEATSMREMPGSG